MRYKWLSGQGLHDTNFILFKSTNNSDQKRGTGFGGTEWKKFEIQVRAQATNSLTFEGSYISYSTFGCAEFQISERVGNETWVLLHGIQHKVCIATNN